MNMYVENVLGELGGVSWVRLKRRGGMFDNAGFVLHLASVNIWKWISD